MKTLEKNIIDRVYVFESKKTFLEIIIRTITVVILLLFISLLGQVIFELLIEQQTFDLFELLKEDIEVIRIYVFDVLYELYEETPKLLTFVFILSAIGLIFVIAKTIENFNRIKNKLKSIFHHFSNR